MRGNKAAVLVTLATFLALAACSGSSASTLGSPAGLLSVPIQAVRSIENQPAGPGLDLIAAYQGTLEQVYQNVNPSVVNVEVIESGAGLQQQLPPGHPFIGGNATALGSGFVWDTEGHIVTNNHVVDGASKIAVTFSDGVTVPGKLVGADPNSDLAVIQVDVSQAELHPVVLADSNQVKVGQMAIAIGNPFGLSGTMTIGIISGLNRSLPVDLNNPSFQQGSTYSIPDIIQTDASINPGNSGGVLVDDQGQLIGVTSAIASPVDANAGVGFVIPSSIVQRVVPTLIKSGHFDHPWLGINGISLTPDLAQANQLEATQQGVLIVQVTGNGPAAEAGLIGSRRRATVSGQRYPVGGDVIVAIDQHPVRRFEELSTYLSENTHAGQIITVTVLRAGQQKDLQLTLGAMPATRAGNQ